MADRSAGVAVETHEPFEEGGKLYLPWLWVRKMGLLRYRDMFGAKEIAMILFDNPDKCPQIKQFEHVAIKDIVVDKWRGPKGGLAGYVVSVREGR